MTSLVSLEPSLDGTYILHLMQIACGTTSCPIRMGKWSSWRGTDDHKHKMRYHDGPARVDIWGRKASYSWALSSIDSRFYDLQLRSCVDPLSFPLIVHGPSQGCLSVIVLM